MTIKQYGGVFGRNPTFNNVTVDGTLTVDQIVEKTGAAGITLDGVTLKDGNVVLADGNGIDFSATAGAGTSELFDDYEEGTFTPDIIGSVSAGTGTYAYRIGRYTKIGDRVLFNLIMSWSAHTGTGFMRIDGLPFTSMASSPYYHAVNIGYIDNVATTAGTVPAGFILNNSTQIWMGEIPTGGGAWAYMGIDTAGDINISGQYEV